MKRPVPLCFFVLFAVFSARADLPHAFTYGGKDVAAIATHGRTVADDARRTKIVHEWTSPDGRLLLRSTETVYKKFPVREYLPELVCVGDAPTEIVDGFKSVSFSHASNGAVLRALRGTVCSDKDFEPVTVAFDAKTPSYSLVATEGRSSAQWMPWMGVDFPAGDGVEVAVGWSGAWQADA